MTTRDDKIAERMGDLVSRAVTAEQRLASLEAALIRWREKYELEEDGRKFVSVPVEVFDYVLPEAPDHLHRHPERPEQPPDHGAGGKHGEPPPIPKIG